MCLPGVEIVPSLRGSLLHAARASQVPTMQNPIFEDVFDFDFNDVINTADKDLCSSDTLNDKNYRWQCLLIVTSNGKDPVHLNYESRGTTHCQSG